MDYIKDIITYDIETPKKLFLACYYNREEDKFYDFLIWNSINQLSELLKFLDESSNKYYVGYNNIGFDSQVIEFIQRSHQDWINLSTNEICLIISNFGSDIIKNSRFGIKPPFKEKDLRLKQIDPPCIHNFFYEKKRVSLKQLEFEMRAPNIETFEFDMDQEFDEESVFGENGIIQYCHNDVIEANRFFDITVGDSKHSMYKGKDLISDRLVMMNEFGIDCLNDDNVGIGSSWNMKDYMEATGKTEKELKPKKINYFFGKKYKQFFPDTVEFTTPRLKKFINELGNTYVLNKKQEFKYKFNSELSCTIARGGIHSIESFRYMKPREGEYYLQLDIGSQYPNAIRKYNVYPEHLGIDWNQMIVSKIERRLNYKKQYKITKEPKYNSMQEMGKDSLNGGSF